MKRLNFLLSLGIAFFAFNIAANAQDSNTDNHTIGITIPGLAIVDIEPAASKNITMAFTAPTEAGQPLIVPLANNTLWLNYSAIKTATNLNYKVGVKLTALINGVDIKVQAGAPGGSGDGELGTAAGELTLTTADQNIITAIGSSYTGNGANNGHNLTYNLAYGSILGAANYADLVGAVTAQTATVTYTITAN